MCFTYFRNSFSPYSDLLRQTQSLLELELREAALQAGGRWSGQDSNL